MAKKSNMNELEQQANEILEKELKKRGFNNAIYPHYIKKNNDDTNKH